jgi:hypothetical protein
MGRNEGKISTIEENKDTKVPNNKLYLNSFDFDIKLPSSGMRAITELISRGFYCVNSHRIIKLLELN